MRKTNTKFYLSFVANGDKKLAKKLLRESINELKKKRQTDEIKFRIQDYKRVIKELS